MQQILIPTDFSKNAWNATSYALRLFENKKITFHFLYVDIFMKAASDVELHSAGLAPKMKISKETEVQMDDWIQRVHMQYTNPNHQFKRAMIQAPFVEGVRTYIVKSQIDFMALGTKGASGLKEMTIGSKAGAIITRVKCPILVIPEAAQFRTPHTIGFPTDFNMLYKDRSMKAFMDVRKMHNSFIKVLRVAHNKKSLDPMQSTNRDLLMQRLMDVPHSFHVINNPNLEDALQSFVNSMQIDMIAMIAKNLNFFQRILFKPKVARISYHLHIPFLVLHE